MGKASNHTRLRARVAEIEGWLRAYEAVEGRPPESLLEAYREAYGALLEEEGREFERARESWLRSLRALAGVVFVVGLLLGRLVDGASVALPYCYGVAVLLLLFAAR